MYSWRKQGGEIRVRRKTEKESDGVKQTKPKEPVENPVEETVAAEPIIEQILEEPIAEVSAPVEQETAVQEVDLNFLKQRPNADAPAATSLGSDAEMAELKEQLLRRRAEFENYKKRMETEKVEFVKFASERVYKELLPIIDSFERALQTGGSDDQPKPIYDGFTLIYKQFQDFLAKNDIALIEAIGQTFDPNLHQAVSQEQQEGVAAGIVIKEYQKGYMLHKRVLRPSMVVVSQ